MTQPFGNSLDIQGNISRFSSEFRLASENRSVNSVTAVLPVKQKKKRGRPRKALPLHALLSDLPQKDGRNICQSDTNTSNGESTFLDEELTTLDEFERLSRSANRNYRDFHDFKRIDEPTPLSAPVALPKRKKVIRRRQIDPATCERDYSQDEVEFMNALDEYKRNSGRMFPTCSEILEVLKNLGYEKQDTEFETA
jgi:hypothetical protein